MSILNNQKINLLQLNPAGTAGFLRADASGDIVLWDGIVTEGQTILHRQSWTGDGTTTIFTINFPIFEVVLLEINGLIYPPTDYSISGSTLTISPAVPSGYLITLIYFESLGSIGISSGLQDATNGLTNNLNVAELGGGLFKNTIIQGNAKDYYFIDNTYLSKTNIVGSITTTNVGIANLNNFSGIYQDNVNKFQLIGIDRNNDKVFVRSVNTVTNIDNQINMNSDGTLDLSLTNDDPTFGNATLQLTQGSVEVSIDSTYLVTDTKTVGNQKGIEYAADYSADTGASALTLTTKGYVDTLAGGITLTAGNGIDITTNAINLRNNTAFINNDLLKWDNTNKQLISSVFTDTGTGWKIGTTAAANDVNSVVIGTDSLNGASSVGANIISIGFGSNKNVVGPGIDSISIGRDTSTVGTSSITIGTTSSTSHLGSIAIGNNANAITDIAISSIAIGNNAQTLLRGSIAIGSDAGTTTGNHGNYTISIGYLANSGTSDIASDSVTIGYLAEAGNVVIGGNASGYISIGQNVISGSSSIAIGGSADGTETIAIGGSANTLRSVVVGTSATATGDFATTIGHGSTSEANSIALGAFANSKSTSISIGHYSGAGTGIKSIGYTIVGYNAGNNQDVGLNAILVGNNADATANYAIAIGSGAQTTGVEAIAIGRNVSNAGLNSVAIAATNDVSSESVAIGFNSSITNSNNSIVLGANSHTTNAVNSIAIGSTVTASAAGAIIIGNSTTTTPVINTIANSVGFGWTVASPSILFAQSAASYINNNVGLVIGGTTLSGDAILELNSTDKGFVPTRVNDPATSILTAVEGMIAYDTSTLQLQSYLNGAWKNIGGAGITPTGTSFKLTRFNSFGNDIEDSRIIDNGTYIGIGAGVNLTRNGEVVQSNGNFTTNGDAQTSKMIARAQTTDATITEMFLDGVSGVINITNNSVLGFNINIIALETDLPAGTNGISHSTKIAQYQGGIKNISGIMSLVDVVTEIILAEDGLGPNWTVDVTASTTVSALKIEVTGEVGVNINWVATIETVETRF